MNVFNLKTFDDPKRERGSQSFCNIYDHWANLFLPWHTIFLLPIRLPAFVDNRGHTCSFFDQLEIHLRFIHASPPLISRILHIAIFIGFSGFLIKLFKPSEANLLFDGSSLILYTIGVAVYITNIVKGLRIVTEGKYYELFPEAEKATMTTAVGREDSLRVLAASNTILALVLVGVLILQAGEWYAERKDRDDAAKYEETQKENAAAATSQKGSSHATRSKKKQ